MDVVKYRMINTIRGDSAHNPFLLVILIESYREVKRSYRKFSSLWSLRKIKDNSKNLLLSPFISFLLLALSLQRHAVLEDRNLTIAVSFVAGLLAISYGDHLVNKFVQ